ncbi:MAG: exodeoxyribonuclease VII large subunit [Bryobacteraceae bacterium]|nr:exodeoxyribonuclease VII large subunit [Bryobacteraceae bacterium]
MKPEVLSPPEGVLTVTALTGRLQRLFALEFDDVRVAGEISGYKVWSSGHAYFTLKDSGAQLRCVLFRGALRYMRFKPADGLAVIARGSVEIRAERGEYQLIVSGLEPQGYGALQLAFEQLKQRLAEEGLFAAERKRALPRFPRRIGIVTSPKGAVIRDMLSVLKRRWPGVHVRLFPAQVQGAGAAGEICAGLDYFSRSGWADAVIVGRGGGSLEDLWTFNEESVARAIAACAVPVVSAVGHETDFTIADFVADLRAPTPSAAAELVMPERREILNQVSMASHRLERGIRYRLAMARQRLRERGIDRATTLLQRRLGRLQQRLDEATYRVQTLARALLQRRQRRLTAIHQRLREQNPRLRLARGAARLAQLREAAGAAIERRLAALERRLTPAAARLMALSPLRVLERGYSIVETAGGRLLRSSADVSAGDELRVRLHRGRLRARVEETE